MTERVFDIPDAAMIKALRNQVDFWRRSYQGAQDVALAACRVAECDSGNGIVTPDWPAAYEDLLKRTATWRAFASRRVPTEWAVAEESGQDADALAAVVVAPDGEDVPEETPF